MKPRATPQSHIREHWITAWRSSSRVFGPVKLIPKGICFPASLISLTLSVCTCRELADSRLAVRESCTKKLVREVGQGRCFVLKKPPISKPSRLMKFFRGRKWIPTNANTTVATVATVRRSDDSPRKAEVTKAENIKTENAKNNPAHALEPFLMTIRSTVVGIGQSS